MSCADEEGDWGNDPAPISQIKQDSLENNDRSDQSKDTSTEACKPERENKKPEVDQTQPSSDEDIRYVMSERNKQTLRNIRLKQLQRDCPHSRDYYNLTLKIRKANQSNNPVEVQTLMQKLYPYYRWGNGEDDEDRYRSPLTNEESSVSLGKVKVFKPSAPRNCLDPELFEKMYIGSGVAVVDSYKAKTRYIYGKIETLYEYLLAYEETEARISLLKYKSDYDEGIRHETLHKASLILMDHDLLSNIIKIEKGKMVVSRLIAALDPSVGTKVLASLIPSFASWEVSSDRKLRRVYICFSLSIHSSKETDFDLILAVVNEESVRKMLTSELGTSFLMLVLEHGQNLYEEANSDGEYRQIWAAFFEMITRTVRDVESLVPPIEIFPEFINRLSRHEDFTDSDCREYWHHIFKLFEENGSAISDGF